MREDNVKAVEAYLNALRDRDLSKAPLADNLIFEDPMAGRGVGAVNFIAFVAGFLPAINGVTIHMHVSEDDHVATRFDVDTEFGIIAVLTIFRVESGVIAEIRVFYDPRPVLGN